MRGRKKRLICHKCGGKGHLARLCPSGDDCQDVDEVGKEPSSDADSDLFGLDWGDDPLRPSLIGTTELVVEKNCWHSLIPVRLTMHFPSQYVPSTPWRRLPSLRAELFFKEQRITCQTPWAATLSSQD